MFVGEVRFYPRGACRQGRAGEHAGGREVRIENLKRNLLSKSPGCVYSMIFENRPRLAEITRQNNEIE
jgi:hypothetical protein